MLQTKDFKKVLHESAEALSTILAEQQTSKKDLLSPPDRQKKIQHELEENTESLVLKMQEGLTACILSLDQCPTLPMSVDELLNELEKCLRVIKNADDLVQLGSTVFSGVSWKNKLGISVNCMQTLYQGARYLFENQEYTQAEKAFFAICSLDPTQYAYWIGLGHSSFQEKNYSQAVKAYSMASALEPENVWPHIWAANCFEEEKDFDYAKMALDEALSLLSSQSPRNHDLIHALEERVQKIKKI